MAEWSNAAVLKTVVRSHVPGVRIPLSPPKPEKTMRKHGFLVFCKAELCLHKRRL